MSKPDSIADRARREADALARLRRERPVLFFIVLLALFGLGAGFFYDRFWGIPALKERLQAAAEKISEKDVRIGVLETQLAPFRALALDRFPGQAEGEALARLTTQIEELKHKFDDAQKTIQYFAAQVSLIVGADWKVGEPSDKRIHSLIHMSGGGSDVTVQFALTNGEQRALSLGSTEELNLKQVPGDGGLAELSYSVAASPGSWIFRIRHDELVACTHISLLLHGLTPETTNDGRITAHRLKVAFFVNGRAASSCTVEFTGGTIELAGTGTTSATWTGKVAVQRTESASVTEAGASSE